MSERDDLAEQAYSTVPVGSMTRAERNAVGRRFDEIFPPETDPEEIKLNRMAQQFYEASGLDLLGVDKPKVVAGLRAVLAMQQGAATGSSPLFVQTQAVRDQLAHAMGGMDYMLTLQRDVEGVWGRLVDPTNPAAVSKYIREVVLCATDELHEVLAEVHWKPWKSSRGIKDMPKYREEMADVLHFILDLYLAAGLTGQDIVLDYVAKHRANMARSESPEYKAS